MRTHPKHLPVSVEKAEGGDRALTLRGKLYQNTGSMLEPLVRGVTLGLSQVEDPSN